MVKLITIIVVSNLGFGTKGFDLRPYGPRMCEKINQGCSENITTFHADSLTCNVINQVPDATYDQKCQTDVHCNPLAGLICSYGICSCLVGLDFDGSSCRDLQECIAFENSYIKNVGKWLWGVGRTPVRNSYPVLSGFSECNGASWCKGINTWTGEGSGYITLTGTWYSTPKENRRTGSKYSKCTYYQRKCSTWKNTIIV